jgi:hypothetical protein
VKATHPSGEDKQRCEAEEAGSEADDGGQHPDEQGAAGVAEFPPDFGEHGLAGSGQWGQAGDGECRPAGHRHRESGEDHEQQR